MNFGAKRLKMGSSFLTILRKFELYFGASHTEASKQNSTKLCDMFRSEPNLKMQSKIFRGSPQNIGGVKTSYFVTVLISTKLCQMTKNRAQGFIHLP